MFVDKTIDAHKFNQVFHRVIWMVLKKNILSISSLLNFLGKNEKYEFYTIDRENTILSTVSTS